MCVDRTGCSKGEVNTASGNSTRFPFGYLRLPPWDEGNSGGKRIKDIKHGISWRTVRLARETRGGSLTLRVCCDRSGVSNTMFLLPAGAP
jgi:hypothetical protein